MEAIKVAAGRRTLDTNAYKGSKVWTPPIFPDELDWTGLEGICGFPLGCCDHSSPPLLLLLLLLTLLCAALKTTHKDCTALSPFLASFSYAVCVPQFFTSIGTFSFLRKNYLKK
jgi:hypothetical protein